MQSRRVEEMAAPRAERRRRWGWHPRLLIVLLGAALVTSPSRTGGAEARTTDAYIAAMRPTEQAALLQPLRRLAGVLDARGRASWARTYAGVELDAAEDAVDLFTTAAATGRS